MKTLAEKIAYQERQQIERAIEWAGNQKRLADVLGVSKQVVNGWSTRGRISATAAAKLEEIDGSYFNKKDMRPDVKEWYL